MQQRQHKNAVVQQLQKLVKHLLSQRIVSCVTLLHSEQCETCLSGYACLSPVAWIH